MLHNKLNRVIIISAFLLINSINSNVVVITSKGQFDKLIKNGPVIADFHGEDFCQPCRNIAAPFKKAAEKNNNITFVKIDAQENQDLSKQYNIMGLPTIILFVDGKKVDQFSGANTGKLQELIDKVGKKAAKKEVAKETPCAKAGKTLAKKRKAEVNEAREERAPKRQKRGGTVHSLSSDEEVNNLISKSGFVIIELTKVGCESCPVIEKPFARKAAQHTDITFAVADKDNVPEFKDANSGNIKGYPAFIIYKNGKFHDAFSGASQEEEKNDRILDMQLKRTGVI